MPNPYNPYAPLSTIEQLNQPRLGEARSMSEVEYRLGQYLPSSSDPMQYGAAVGLAGLAATPQFVYDVFDAPNTFINNNLTNRPRQDYFANTDKAMGAYASALGADEYSDFAPTPGNMFGAGAVALGVDLRGGIRRGGRSPVVTRFDPLESKLQALAGSKMTPNQIKQILTQRQTKPTQTGYGDGTVTEGALIQSGLDQVLNDLPPNASLDPSSLLRHPGYTAYHIKRMMSPEGGGLYAGTQPVHLAELDLNNTQHFANVELAPQSTTGRIAEVDGVSLGRGGHSEILNDLPVDALIEDTSGWSRGGVVNLGFEGQEGLRRTHLLSEIQNNQHREAGRPIEAPEVKRDRVFNELLNDLGKFTTSTGILSPVSVKLPKAPRVLEKAMHTRDIEPLRTNNFSTVKKYVKDLENWEHSVKKQEAYRRNHEALSGTRIGNTITSLQQQSNDQFRPPGMPAPDYMDPSWFYVVNKDAKLYHKELRDQELARIYDKAVEQTADGVPDHKYSKRGVITPFTREHILNDYEDYHKARNRIDTRIQEIQQRRRDRGLPTPDEHIDVPPPFPPIVDNHPLVTAYRKYQMDRLRKRDPDAVYFTTNSALVRQVEPQVHEYILKNLDRIIAESRQGITDMVAPDTPGLYVDMSLESLAPSKQFALRSATQPRAQSILKLEDVSGVTTEEHEFAQLLSDLKQLSDLPAKLAVHGKRIEENKQIRKVLGNQHIRSQLGENISQALGDPEIRQLTIPSGPIKQRTAKFGAANRYYGGDESKGIIPRELEKFLKDMGVNPKQVMSKRQVLGAEDIYSGTHTVLDMDKLREVAKHLRIPLASLAGLMVQEEELGEGTF